MVLIKISLYLVFCLCTELLVSNDHPRTSVFFNLGEKVIGREHSHPLTLKNLETKTKFYHCPKK